MKQSNGEQTNHFVQITELLRTSEERFHRMIEELEDYAIIMLDENGMIQNWNKGAEKIKGYQETEVLGKHFSIFYLPDDQAADLPTTLLERARNEGKAVHEGWRLRKNGTHFWASTTLTVLHDEENKGIGFSKVTRDLTDRKMAEDKLKVLAEQLQGKNEALMASEERYHKMVDEVEEYAIIFLDSDGIIRNWNKGAQKIKQYTKSEAVGRHFSMFYLPEDRMGKLPEILLAQAVKYGRAIHEGWRMRKDRTKFWGSVTLTALHHENGELIGFSKVTRDLTEKKMAEDQLRNYATELQVSNQALRTSEERYHKMIAEVQDYAIILLDIEGNIQNWNVGAEKIKGYTADEVLGKNFQVFYNEQDRARNLPQQLLAEAALSGRAVHEGWRVTKNGSRFWGSIVITALHDNDGNLMGYSKVTRDLTEKKQTEDKLREYVRDLQRQNEELDRFAYAASHDLQEPLRKVQTFADLIEQSPDNAEVVNHYIKKIITSADRMLALIRSILNYSKIDKLGSEKINTDVGEMFEGVLWDFELLIAEKQAQVHAGPMPIIKAVPQQITQLFSNLISNALKFSRDKPIISLSAAIVSTATIVEWPDHLPQGEYHQLTIADNGIGFEPRYARQIFSLFQRLHGKHEFAGTGIGLALCKKIMDNHEGFISAQSCPGEGSTFHLYFPVIHN